VSNTLHPDPLVKALCRNILVPYTQPELLVTPIAADVDAAAKQCLANAGTFDSFQYVYPLEFDRIFTVDAVYGLVLAKFGESNRSIVNLG
jgi:hypothetical protein